MAKGVISCNLIVDKLEFVDLKSEYTDRRNFESDIANIDSKLGERIKVQIRCIPIIKSMRIKPNEGIIISQVKL